MLTGEHVVETGLDAAALKPAEVDLDRASQLPFDRLVVDWEGPEHAPDYETLRRLAETAAVRVTTPVRADGFDPLGDDARAAALPDAVGRVLVAGHSAYLSKAEHARAVSPRLGAAADAHPDAWVGTECVERVALATGNPQFELLDRTTVRDVRGLRAAGFDGTVAVYAPTVLADDEDALLDAVGGYVARRGPVADALPEGAQSDATARGRARDVLLAAIEDFALVGTPGDVREQVVDLKDAGVDVVVGYPARGLEDFLA